MLMNKWCPPFFLLRGPWSSCILAFFVCTYLHRNDRMYPTPGGLTQLTRWELDTCIACTQKGTGWVNLGWTCGISLYVFSLKSHFRPWFIRHIYFLNYLIPQLNWIHIGFILINGVSFDVSFDKIAFWALSNLNYS